MFKSCKFFNKTFTYKKFFKKYKKINKKSFKKYKTINKINNNDLIKKNNLKSEIKKYKIINKKNNNNLIKKYNLESKFKIYENYKNNFFNFVKYYAKISFRFGYNLCMVLFYLSIILIILCSFSVCLFIICSFNSFLVRNFK